MPISNEERRALDQHMVEAAFVCDLKRVRTLLSRGANPNARDVDGRTPIFSAVLGGRGGRLGVVREAKSDVNTRHERGAPPRPHPPEEGLPAAAPPLTPR